MVSTTASISRLTPPLITRPNGGIAGVAGVGTDLRLHLIIRATKEAVVSHPSEAQGLSGLRVVVQCDAHGASVVPVILADDGLAAKLPQSRVVIAASCHQVRRVSAEGTVPNPALVACQRGLLRERFEFSISVCSRLLLFTVCSVAVRQERDLGRVRVDEGHRPDLGRVVCRAGCELLDVGR